MIKAAFDSEQISANFHKKYENITSVVVSNYGNENITVTVRNVTRIIPPVLKDFNVPFAPFKIESFGNGFDLDLRVEFPAGSGNAIIDTLKLIEC